MKSISEEFFKRKNGQKLKDKTKKRNKTMEKSLQKRKRQNDIKEANNNELEIRDKK